MATSASPLGPWTDSGAPVVEPHAPSCCPADKRWVFDPAIVTDDGGGTWTHNLGNGARIGLVSMGGSGFTTQFDYVRVYTLDRTIDQP